MNAQARESQPHKIYLKAVQISDAQERRAYLEQTCGEDASLRERVEKLLSAREQSGANLLQQAVAGQEAAARQTDENDFAETQKYDPEAMDLEPGRVFASPVGGIDVSEHPMIGPYKLLQEIGQGGMGTVYMAQQTEPVKRKVALKIIKPGMDSKDVLARFEAERQALAMMDHPSIAKVLDGGTTDTGRPYFVMDLVHGTPMTTFCREAGLSTRQRLELFVDVCRAVQHAHLKGIIHRDLKPSNVLVTMNDDKPLPKVIDFGVSKALSSPLTEKTLFTAYGQMVGTPLYMSPEQAQFSAQDVDIRSDVYSLGVMLYELLTGSTPFDKDTLKKSGFDEMRRLIREVDPPRPSARVSTLKAGELSTLSGNRQVDAKKFSQSLKGELDWIVMKALEKDRGRRYESASAFAADLERYLKDEPVQACPPTVGYRLRKYAKRYKGLITTAAILVTMLIASTMVSAVFAFQASEARDEANEQKEEAVRAKDLADERLGAEQKARQETEEERERAHANYVRAREAVNQMLTRVANEELARIPEMKKVRRRLLEDAAAFYTELIALNRRDPLAYYERARVYLLLMEFDKVIPDLQAAIALQPDRPEFHKTLAYYLIDSPQIAHRDSKSALLHARWAVRLAPGDALCRNTLARVYIALRRHDEARRECERALALDSSSADVLFSLAKLSRTTGDPKSAFDYLKRAIDINPNNAYLYHFMGSIYRAMGDDERAIAAATKAIALANKTSDESLNTRYGWTYVLRAEAYKGLGMHQQALNDYAIAIELGPFRQSTYMRRTAIQVELGDLKQARADLNAVLAADDVPYYALYQVALLSLGMNDADRYRNLCQRMLSVFAESEKALETHFTAWTCALAPNAIEDYTLAIKLARHAVEQNKEDKQYLNGMGAILMRAGRYEEAKKHLSQALEVVKNAKTSSSYIRYFLAMTEHHLGNKEAAKEHLRAANESAEKELGSPAWNRKLTLELLRKEAEALIGKPTSSKKKNEPEPAVAVPSPDR